MFDKHLGVAGATMSDKAVQDVLFLFAAGLLAAAFVDHIKDD